MVKIWWS